METLVLTVIGTDRPGIVEALSRAVLAEGANWEASRMAHLADRFAGIVLVTVDGARIDALAAAMRALCAEGLAVSVERGDTAAKPVAAGRPVRLDLVGSDRPGILHAITGTLARRGVNVEELSSEVVAAPEVGDALFKLNAGLRLPPGLALDALRTDLETVAADLMVDLVLAEP